MHPARRLTVVVDEDARHGHRALYEEIVHRAHAAGLAGASVFRGIEGFGASRRLHTNRLLSLSSTLPVMVLIVDAAEKIDAFLPQLDDLGPAGLVVIEDVQVYGP